MKHAYKTRHELKEKTAVDACCKSQFSIFQQDILLYQTLNSFYLAYLF